jgi:aquaporin Z
LLGTFFLVLVIGLTVIGPGAGAMAPVAIGFMLAVMVYAGGPISGAHYNPAVTLAVWLRGKCDTALVPAYMAAQLIGSVLAALLVGFLKQGHAVIPLELRLLPAFAIELAFTFALAWVVLEVATTKRAAGNSYFGLAIGSTVMAGAYAGGDISGGAFNPAVALGMTIMGLASPSTLWLFLVAGVAGGALAAWIFRVVNPNE